VGGGPLPLVEEHVPEFFSHTRATETVTDKPPHGYERFPELRMLDD
jgi:hypothetical protein